MQFADLSMINLHRRSDGKWSYTAYKLPHQMWRSNTGLTDPLICLNEIWLEMGQPPDLFAIPIESAGAFGSTPSDIRARPSGGRFGESAVVRKQRVRGSRIRRKPR